MKKIVLLGEVNLILISLCVEEINVWLEIQENLKSDF